MDAKTGEPMGCPVERPTTVRSLLGRTNKDWWPESLPIDILHQGGLSPDPMGDDFVLAEKGAGAWQTGGHRPAIRLKAAAPVDLEDMTGMASTGFLPQDRRARVMANLAKVAFASNYRCAAHEYRTFAAGHLHYLMYNKLMPWDHLAGTLISQEAGAYAARFDGSPYKPRHVEGGLLLAPDRDSWEMMRREVFTVD